MGVDHRKVALAALAAAIVAMLIWPTGHKPTTRTSQTPPTQTLKINLPALPASVEQVHVVFLDQTRQIDLKPKLADTPQTLEIEAPAGTNQEILIEVTQAGTRRPWTHLTSTEPELTLPALTPAPPKQERPFRSAFTASRGQTASQRSQEIQSWRNSHPAPRVPRR